MKKTLEKQLNNLTLEQLFDVAKNLDTSFWTYEDLKNFVVDKIQNNDILVATHILNALNSEPANYYNYDDCMGTFEEVTPITTKEDFVGFLKNYYDEDITKTIKEVL